METMTQTAAVSKKAIWAGRIISALLALLLIFSAVMAITKPPAVVDGFTKFGYPERLIPVIAILELSCAVLYLIPRTSILGAILLTGYFGGATATHIRISDPSFIMPVLAGVLAWLGLFLRDDRVRALIPLKR
jgi:hypothetical protein